MAQKTNPRRYAQAAFEIALEKEELDRWLSDLEQMAALGSNEEFITLMASSKLSFDEKTSFIVGRLDGVNPLALNLLYLLITRGRLDMLGDIVAEYRRLLDSYRGIEEARVVTAVPLSDEDKPALEERLSALTGKKIIIQSEVDPSLLGGIVARVGGKLLDGSTRSRLQALKREMAGRGDRG